MNHLKPNHSVKSMPTVPELVWNLLTSVCLGFDFKAQKVRCQVRKTNIYTTLYYIFICMCVCAYYSILHINMLCYVIISIFILYIRNIVAHKFMYLYIYI